MCHLILLLPFVGLPVFWLWPLELALPVYLLILLLSGWVYYYTIAAIRRKVAVGPETLLHSRGEVVGQDAVQTWVRVEGELWGATTGDELHPGDAVEVVGIEGLVLQVSRLDSSRGSVSVHH